MPRVLFIFLDGIGLGTDDQQYNPFAIANTPTLHALSNGLPWLNTTGIQRTKYGLFLPTDANLGVPGMPQSASGQAAMLTGLNVPEMIGEHYGPRPNPPIRAILAADNLFKRIVAAGGTTALLEGYPPRFHESVTRGKRLLASYQQAVVEAGFTLFDDQAIYSGDALPVDFTGEAWRGELGYTDTPLYTPVEAGHKLVELARRYTFSFFPHWYTDTLGHRGTMPQTIRSLEVFDGVMQGVLELWNPDEGLVIISSDHGNMEDMTQAHHTMNPVPTVVIGREAERFAALRDLTDLAPLIEQYLIG